eukprot:symbB.v1.2.014086.t1/scaffold1016.1/size143805/4
MDTIPSFGPTNVTEVRSAKVLHTLGFNARQKRRKTRQELVQTFLQCYGFRDVHSTKLVPRAHGEEEVYPIHVAAELGDALVLGSLLLARVDLHQRTSSGRTAMELAQLADCNGSHFEAIERLKSLSSEHGKMSVHQFRQMLRYHKI